MMEKDVGKKAKAAGISDATVRARTGHGWKEWFKILDLSGARKRNHTEIAAYLQERKSCPPWWSQMIAVAYEQERGMREKHETPSGYSISRSTTVAVPISKLYAAWEEKRLRGAWLEEPGAVLRKATPQKSVRMTWFDGKTSVDANFYAKEDGKSQVTVEHSKLADSREAERMKAYWAERLERLKRTLEA